MGKNKRGSANVQECVWGPQSNIRIGTSGWHYRHWSGLFYPADLPKSRWFDYYARDFDTVEINNTFYQLPKQQTLKNWYEQAPQHFIYSVKANRYITHIKRLKETSGPLERFFETVGLLKSKLGPVLYQLPPNFHKDLNRLSGFIKQLRSDVLSVFEFRHKSWFSQDTLNMLDEFGAGFCIHDMAGAASPRAITGKIIYIRFHGPTSSTNQGVMAGKYDRNYSESELQKWAQWIKKHRKQVHNIYIYFNNDYRANAISNAKILKAQF